MYEISGHPTGIPVFLATPPRDNTTARMLDDLRITDYALDSRTHLIEVEGQVDLYSAPEFKERTARVLGERKQCVIIDLARVRFIDSTGLSVLLGAFKRLRAGRAELRLVVIDYDIERLFELTGLDRAFKIYRSRDEALEGVELAQGS
jgi:anti-sigma B factor antagonist